MKKLYLLLIAAIALITACENLEDVIRDSKKEPTVYGNDLYWQGCLVGKKEYFSSSDNKASEKMLKDRGLWIYKTYTVPGYYAYDPVKKKSVWVPGYTLYTQLTSGEKVYNRDGILICATFAMDVPREAVYYFSYNMKEDKVEPLSTSRNDYYISMMGSLPPDPKIAENMGSEPVDSFEFERRYALSLNEGTEEHQTTAHFETGCGYKYLKVFKDKAVSDKADSKLNVDLDPIFLAYFKYDIAWRFFYLKGEASSSFKDKGGEVLSDDEAAEKMGISKNKSFLIQAAAGLFGAEAKFTYYDFRMGTAKYYTSSKAGTFSHDTLSNEFAFQVKKKQFDMIYHPLWRDIPRLGGLSRKTKVLDGYFGYRYVEYSVPGIIYSYDTEEIENKDNPEEKETIYTVYGESYPQEIKYKLHMIGAGFNNFLSADDPGLNFLIALECYAGYGRTRADYYGYRAPKDVSTVKGYVEKNQKLGTFSLAPCGTLGLMYNFTTGDIKTRLRFAFDTDCYVNFQSDKDKYQISDGSSAHMFYAWNVAFDVLF